MTSIVLSKHFFFLTGIVLILIAYTFQQTNWMKIKGFLYNFINMLGGGFFVYAVFQPLQLEFFIFSAVWTFISIVRLFKSFK